MDTKLSSSSVVTIFGGSGFIGRSLVFRLARTGATIRVVARNPKSALSTQPAGNVGQVVPFAADVTKAGDVERAVEGATHVVNLVGILAEGGGRRSFEVMHGEVPGLIAEAAAKHGVLSLVHVSAIGASPDGPSAYGRSKAKGEAALRAAYPEAVILRPSVVFGPEDAFFNRFGRMARFAPVLPLVGPDTRFQPVYVEDVTAALAQTLQEGAHRGQTFELGGPAVYTFRECLEILLKEIQRDKRFLVLPFGLAEMQGKLLGWLPNAPITYDQVQSLKVDNVVAEDARTLGDLGLTPTPLEVVLPTYAWIYRPGGRFGARTAG